MNYITVLKERCPQNHHCPSIGVCRVSAISQKGYLAPEINYSLCVKCGKCINNCPMGAFVIKNG